MYDGHGFLSSPSIPTIIPVSAFSYASNIRRAITIGLFALALISPLAGFSQPPDPAAPETSDPGKVQGPGLKGEPLGQGSSTPAPAPPAPEKSKPVLNWDTGAGKSYLIPALEIIGYELLLNQFDRHFVEPKSAYRSGTKSFWNNLTDSNWVIDNDQFSVNQFLHPYGGTIYYGLARSSGLNFWESSLYTAAGSFIWELGGETTPPSANDQYTTTLGGIFLGEPLFRMASLLLETDEEGKPGWLRELGAAILSPPTGFNRLAFGDRFDAVFPSHKPATFMRLMAGGTLTSSSHNVSSNVKPRGAAADFEFTYGLPGKPGYTYKRPFDYFDFHLSAVTANTIESIDTRGLLIGTTYAPNESVRGIWGLYGTYDYISPQVFRVSSTGVSLGTTWQWWASRDVALQGTVLAGGGYGAAGSIERTEDRDYHDGITSTGLLALRLIFGDRAMLDLTGREFYVSGLLSTEPKGYENILRGDASLTVRVFERHGIALRYVSSHRDAGYPNVEYRDQTVGTVSLMYVFLGKTHFGAVDWRNN